MEKIESTKIIDAILAEENKEQEHLPIDDSKSTIPVGILHSLSGTMSKSEAPIVEILLMAIDEINDSGGVLNRKVKPIALDGASESSTFISSAETLIDQHNVVTIFGCWTSSSRKAVKPIVEDRRSLLWYPVQYEGLEQSKNIVYTGSCLNQQIVPAFDWAFTGQRKSCFLIGSDYVFPRTANSFLRTLAKKHGIEILGEEYIPLSSHNVEDFISKIKVAKPDIIFNTINGDANIDLFKAFKSAGLDPKKHPVMSFSFTENELNLVPEDAAGHYACWGYFISLDTEENRSFIEKVHTRFNSKIPISEPMVAAYSQVFLWKNIVELIGDCKTEMVLKHLHGASYHGPMGLMEIKSNNHVMKRALIGQANKDGLFDIIWESKSVIEPMPWLGVEDSDLPAKDLVISALGQYPEVIHLNTILKDELKKRTETEEARKESETKFRNLIESLVDVLFVIGQDGQFLEVNATACERLGYTREELLKMSPHDIHPAEDQDFVNNQVKQVWDTGGLIFETTHISKSGAEIPVEIKASVVNYNGQPCIMVLARDITERKKAEKELKESNELLGAAQHISKIGIWRWDVKKDLIEWSDELFKITGLDPKLGTPNFQKLPSIYTQESWAILSKAVEKAVSSGKSYDLKIDMVHANGHLVHTHTIGHSMKDGNGNIIKLWGVVQDITEQKKAEQKLQDAQNRLKIALSSSKMFMWEYRVKDDVISGDKLMLEIFGLPLDQAIDLQSIVEKIHPDDVEKATAIMSDALSRETDYINEYRIIPKEGQVRWIEGRGRSYLDEKGNVSHVIGIGLDITEQKNIENELKLTTERLSLGVEAGNLGIWDWDIINNLTTWNDKMFEIYDLPHEVPMPYENWSNAVYPDDLKNAEASLQRVIEKKIKDFVEFRIVHPDGSIHHIQAGSLPVMDSSNKVIRIIGVNLDITNHKEAEEELKSAQERLMIALSSSNMGMWEYRVKEDKITADKLLLEIFGLPLDQEIDLQSTVEKIHPDDVEKATAIIGDAFTREMDYINEYRVIPKEGQVRWVDARGRSYLDENGNVSHVIGIALDITEKKKAEEELKKANLRLNIALRSSKMGSWEYTVKNDMITADNMLLEIYGLPLDQKVDLSHTIERIHPEDREGAVEVFNHALSEPTEYLSEYRVISREGDIHWVDIRGKSFIDDDGKVSHVIGIAMDITEKKNAEDNLKLEEKRLQALFELSQMREATEKEITDFALEAAVELTKSKVGYLHFYEAKSGNIELYSWSKETLKYCTAEKIPHYELERAGVWADCIREKAPVIHNDYQNLPNKKGLPEGHFPLIRHLT